MIHFRIWIFSFSVLSATSPQLITVEFTSVKNRWVRIWGSVFETSSASGKPFLYLNTYHILYYFIPTLWYTLFYELFMISHLFSNYLQRKSPSTITEVPWVHVCYQSHDYSIGWVSYNGVIVLHNACCFMIHSYLIFWHRNEDFSICFCDAITSTYWFNIIYIYIFSIKTQPLL